MAHLVKTKTADSDKNFWSTTWKCFADAQHLYGRKFECDVAAEPLTAKVKNYMTGAEFLDKLQHYRHRDELRSQLATAEAKGFKCIGLDSLQLRWPDNWWCNPPFDLKFNFIEHARRQQHDLGTPGMFLLPYEPATGWWRELLGKGAIIYEPDGRYQFYERDGETEKGNVNFPSAFVSLPSQRIGESIRVPFTRWIGAR